jgi:hypothetical protein
MGLYWRGPHGPSGLALELSGKGIRLVERTRVGGWEVLGTAPLNEDFTDRIDALRVEALVRGPGPVDLWLPPDQLIVRRYELPRGGRDRAEALRRLSAETGRHPDDLCVVICPAPAGEPTTVLAVLARTVAEAREYARRWGFRPGSVSFRPDAAPPGVALPVFGSGRALPFAHPSSGRGIAAAAAAAVALLGFAGWGVLQLAPGDEPPSNVSKTAPVLALARVEAALPDLPHAPGARVRHRQSQALPLPPRSRRVASGPGLAVPTALPAPGAVVELAQPSPGVRMRVGPAPELPDRWRLARLGSATAVADRLDLVALVNAMDRLREETTLRAGSKPLTMASVTVLAPGRGGEPAAEAQGAGSPESVQLASVSAAPRQVPEAPAPRPETQPEAAEDEPASALAAPAAPQPPAKPEQKARLAASAVANPANAGDPSLAAVRRSASLQGLELDSTSLIGILDAQSGRQALLRTAAGEFLKVGRGDSVEGWRVSAINREAVRLTRGAQSRTLLLTIR